MYYTSSVQKVATEQCFSILDDSRDQLSRMSGRFPSLPWRPMPSWKTKRNAWKPAWTLTCRSRWMWRSCAGWLSGWGNDYDKKTVKNYFNNQAVSFTNFSNFSDLKNALNNGTISYIIVPRMEYVDEILKNNFKTACAISSIQCHITVPILCILFSNLSVKQALHRVPILL